MHLRIAIASLLLLGPSAFAQETKQDPDKPQPTPVDVARDLAAERDRLQREINYVKERAKNGKAAMAGRLAAPKQDFRSIDAGKMVQIAPPAPTMPVRPRAARVATPDEMNNHAQDTMLVVNGRAIATGVYEGLVEFMASNPAAGDEKMRSQRALYELIQTEAIASAFEENEAAEKVGEVFGQIDAGKPIADLAKTIGVVPGASPEGRVEVTRNSQFGPRFEQAAFTTEAGKRARAFRNQNGLVILQVDSIEKGATPDLDKVIGTAVQIPYTPEAASLQKAQQAVNTGQIDILVRDQKTFDMLPEFFRPMAPVPATTPVGAAPNAADMTKLTAQLQQLQTAMDALRGKTDAESVRQLQILEQQHTQLKAMLRAAQAQQDDMDIDKGGEKPAEKVPPVKKG
jgi:hypothetical protein